MSAAAAETDLPSIATLHERFSFAPAGSDRGDDDVPFKDGTGRAVLLGSGRSGSVLRGHLRSDPVAIKVYRNTPAAINDAARELLILLVLAHQLVRDCVPRVRQAFVWKPVLDEHIRAAALDGVKDVAARAVYTPGNEYVVLATQLIPDTVTLHAFRTKLHAMGRDDKAVVVRQLLHSAVTALRAMHRVGVVHRDIKPGNLLVRRQRGAGDDKHETVYSLLFIDFGFSALYLPDDDAHAPQLSVGARPDVGTPMYMAPELLSACFRNKRDAITWPMAAAADWWALGATLLYAACGTSVLPRVRTLRRHCEEAERYDGPPLTLYVDAPDLNRALCQLHAYVPTERCAIKM